MFKPIVFPDFRPKDIDLADINTLRFDLLEPFNWKGKLASQSRRDKYPIAMAIDFARYLYRLDRGPIGIFPAFNLDTSLLGFSMLGNSPIFFGCMYQPTPNFAKTSSVIRFPRTLLVFGLPGGAFDVVINLFQSMSDYWEEKKIFCLALTAQGNLLTPFPLDSLDEIAFQVSPNNNVNVPVPNSSEEKFIGGDLLALVDLNDDTYVQKIPNADGVTPWTERIEHDIPVWLRCYERFNKIEMDISYITNLLFRPGYPAAIDAAFAQIISSLGAYGVSYIQVGDVIGSATVDYYSGLGPRIIEFFGE